MRYIPLEKLINLFDGYSRTFRVDHHELLLLQSDGECFLLEARCPHAGHALSSAALDGQVLRCSLHGYEFSLRDGKLLLATEAPCRPLRIYRLVYEGNEVGVIWEG